MKKQSVVLLLLVLIGSMHGLIGFGESNNFSWVEESELVELSYFAAMVNAQNYVSVSWTSQSESGLLGYRILRSQDQHFYSAGLITPDAIPPANTSNAHTYTHEDREVESNTTYNYWLEIMGQNYSSYHGPVSASTLSDPELPVPDKTRMYPAYPNPFRHSTSIGIDVKANETASLTIYNISGQVIKTCRLASGSHQLNWDGKNSRGQTCTSGIYLARLKSPSGLYTTKLVLLK